jgi:Big-like domain-containing protein
MKCLSGLGAAAPIVLLAVAACSEPASSPPQPSASKVGEDAGAIPNDYVVTPAGWYHRSCVHQIEDGALVGRNGLVRRKDGSTYQLPKCGYPIQRARGRPDTRGRPAARPPADSGWIEFAYDFTPGSFRQLDADWTVPAAPTTAYSGQRVYFTFPGIQSDAFILQPVIQYGWNGEYGGNFWTMTAWHCDSGPGCTHSTPIAIATGNAMHGNVVASDCANGECTWTVSTRNVTTGGRTILSLVDTDDYFFVTGGAVEVYGLTTCSQYPRIGVSYSGISLVDTYGQFSPLWFHSVPENPDPNCTFNVASTTNTVNLYHNPLTITVRPSPTTVCPYGSGTLTATATEQTGNVITSGTVAWSSSNTSIATVTLTGSRTASVAGVAVGQATVSGTLEGVRGQSNVTVADCLAPPTNCQLEWIPPPQYLRVTWANSGEAGVSTEVEILKDGGTWTLVATEPPGITSYYYVLGSQTGLFYARVRHVKQGYAPSSYCNTGAKTVG